jgi:hypothetical protein
VSLTLDERPILDRIPFFDPRSKRPEFRARNIVGETSYFKRVWTPRKEPLDQGGEGECVGFSCAGELAATPYKYEVDNATGRRIFAGARWIDREEGRYYPEGATVLAGMKACLRGNLFKKYVWNFGIDDTIAWICRRGPVVLGINWYDSMYDPSERGLLSIGGRIAGGHAIMANGYWPGHPDFGDVLVLTNSWGLGWGIRGRGFLPVGDAKRLLSEYGESVGVVDVPLKLT